MAGKNKIELATALIMDDTGGTARTLSADLVPGSLSITFNNEQVTMTGSSDTVDNFLLGRRIASISAQFYVNDTATTGAHTVLSAQVGTNSSTGYTLTAQFGSAGATPTSNDIEFEGDFLVQSYNVSNSGGAIIATVNFVPLSGGTAPAWGTVA